MGSPSLRTLELDMVTRCSGSFFDTLINTTTKSKLGRKEPTWLTLLGYIPSLGGIRVGTEIGTMVEYCWWACSSGLLSRLLDIAKGPVTPPTWHLLLQETEATKKMPHRCAHSSPQFTSIANLMEAILAPRFSLPREDDGAKLMVKTNQNADDGAVCKWGPRRTPLELFSIAAD